MSATVVKQTQKIETDLFLIEIAEDGMSAFARIKNFSEPLQKIASELKQLLSEHHITRGLISDNARKLLKDQNPNQRMVIAKGVQPVPGKAAEVREISKFISRAEIDPNRLKVSDLGELKHQNLVFKDKPLIRIIPPVPTQDGWTVTGTRIPAKIQVSMERPKIITGPNTAFSPDDPDLIIATVDGLATFVEQTVAVEAYTVVKGDMGPEIGSLDEKRPVLVLGDVKAGSTIESSGDVEIYGTVEDVSIKSGRDIIIHRGFVGRGKGTLKSQRHTILTFALYQTIEANDTVFFLTELIGCKVSAGQKVVGRTGGIIGGETKGLFGIQVHFAGSEEAVVTKLMVGRREQLVRRKREMDDLIVQYQESIKENKQKMYELVMKQIDNKITEIELEHLNSLQIEKKMIPEKIREIEEKLTDINELVKDLENADIEIRGIVNEKVSLSICDARLMVQEKARRKRYYLSGDKILAGSL
ncbi:MAG: FapA family protein [Calditrichia bacterium]|nr:DUF342 domain-containing protein [Calditrichota bacterium]MCB0266743.1 DUF342 domain-containing protein [Calditrichota bacterium]MCB0287442.1 DUF342 domain-containing protein [Calditrichota bacterium]MCB9068368.1 DUF342 domain-containing protein [Calditrichia bacterium]